MLNLGPYSARNFSGIRIHPTMVDRILEGVALLMLLVAWASAIWVYTHVENPAVANYSFFSAGLGTFIVLLLGVCAYLPIRWVRFPVRINERNAAAQYFLAIRVARIVNIIMSLLFLVLVFDKAEAQCGIPQGLCGILVAILGIMLIVVFIVYYILAFKYK